MGKFKLLGVFFLLAFKVSGQYREYPKLRALYDNGKYDKCIEKAFSLTKEKPTEIRPYVWQMRSYLAIDEMESHPLKKNAISKALNIALRIKKKDKEELLNDELKNDFETIVDRNINRVMDLTETHYNDGLALFEKLETLDNSLYLEYRKYHFMKQMGDESAFNVLRELVARHYSLYKKRLLPPENFENAYANLMDGYFENDHPENARAVYFKAIEIYKSSHIFKECYLDYIADAKSYIGYFSDENSIESFLGEYITADSLFNNDITKMAIHDIKRYLAISRLRNEALKSKNTINSIIDYLSVFKPFQYDSANVFFNRLLNDNSLENLKIDNNRILDYWVSTKSEIKKLKQPLEAIRSIHQYLLLLKKYELDAEFLIYCKEAYPALKSAIQPMNADLEKCILAEISKPGYEDNLNDYAKKTDNKAIRDKQYKAYVSKLTTLLETNNFSGFAVNIVKALKQYPNDPQLLALKKQWVIRDYKANYLNTNYGYEQYFTRKPNESTCDPGLVNKKGHEIVLQKINYCRRLAGSPDSCILDETMNLKCQQAAFMMSVNGALSHYPPKTWKCYTQEGASGAGCSNLSLGNAFHDAIMGQMEDDGSGNTACGHRRWILNPANTVFGHGSTMGTSSLAVFGTKNVNMKRKICHDENQPICWPSTDFFPIWLVPQRWSFSLDGTDFKNVKVQVTENGKPLDIMLEPLSYGYGLNTIVWVINGQIEANKTYVVTISDVIPYSSVGMLGDNKPETRTYTYRVTPIEIN